MRGSHGHHTPARSRQPEPDLHRSYCRWGVAGSDAEAPKVARAGNDVFILWHQFPDPLALDLQPDVYIARSTNQGVTFRPRMNLSNTPTGTSDQEDIAASRSGNQTRVYVVWIENTAGVTDVVFRRDRTNDGTYATPKKLNGTLGTDNARNPHVVASGDNVFVIWEADGAGAMPDVFFTRSTNSGDTFKDTQNLSNNAGESLDSRLVSCPTTGCWSPGVTWLSARSISCTRAAGRAVGGRLNPSSATPATLWAYFGRAPQTVMARNGPRQLDTGCCGHRVPPPHGG